MLVIDMGDTAKLGPGEVVAQLHMNSERDRSELARLLRGQHVLDVDGQPPRIEIKYGSYRVVFAKPVTEDFLTVTVYTHG